jgi:tRNA pseudouridine55 synthase
MNIVEKNLGETPLECLERFRIDNNIESNIPITYAGRLDPMATGKLIILTGEECKNKDDYLNWDKEYEVEILFGFTTDSYDILGIPKIGLNDVQDIDQKCELIKSWYENGLKFEQKYPPFSSKTILGTPLHAITRKKMLVEDEVWPTKQVEIYKLDILESKNVSATFIKENIIKSINLVHGDFRQDEIVAKWLELLKQFEISVTTFPIIKLRVACSSGTYMRSLAHTIGERFGVGAIAWSIHRTRFDH